MIDSPKSDNTKSRVEPSRMQDIVVQLVDIIKLLSKKQKINTTTVLKHYTNISADEFEVLDIQITSDAITKK
jgi:hypothetical protein